MKHNFTYALTLIAALLITACEKDDPKEPAPAPVYVPLSVETEMGNQFNHGFATGDQQNIYFYNYEKDRSVKLYKKDRVTGQATVLDQLAAPGENNEVLYSALHVSGEWLYYSPFEIKTDNRGTIWRIKTDGTAKEMVSAAETSEVRYYKDKIYYTTQSEPKGLYSVSMSGGEATYITEPLYRFSILGDRIFYLTYDYVDEVFSYTLNTCELDGSKKKVLYTMPGYMAYVVGSDKIYMFGGETSYNLMSMGLDGSTPKTLLTALPSGSINIEGDMLLLSFSESSNRYTAGIYKHREGYKMPILINAASTYFIMAVGGDKIVFQNENDKYERFGQLYQTNFNGGENAKLIK